MQKENISLLQLLVLVFIFLLGSSIIMGVGTGARQDAWLAILMATFIGIGLMYFYYTLNRLLPNKNLFEIMEYCLSRPIAIFFSIAYILYFFYITCRLLRDFAELISSAILVVTPIEVITLSLMLVIAYILYLGLEVLGRVSEIFAPYLIGFLLLLILFLMGSGELDFRNLQPILGEGFKPIMNEVFPSLITFPFGELIVFTVVLSHVTEFKKGKKVVLMGVLLAGIFLMTGTVVMLLVLGTESIQITNFPLLSAARKISIGEFIERTDAIVVFIMMLGVLVKCSIFFYGGLKGLEYVFRIPYRYFTVPVSMNISVFSVLVSGNFAEHLEEGLNVSLYYIHPPMQFLIPIVLMFILMWKTKKHKSIEVKNQC